MSRLQAIATPLVPNMEKVQIIPPPKEVDPRVLAWKGAAVLSKMDSVSDLWVTSSDWVCSYYFKFATRSSHALKGSIWYACFEGTMLLLVNCPKKIGQGLCNTT